MIDRFTGEHFFLSNFYPVDIVYEGRKYASTEHAFQAAKLEDKGARAKFVDITAGQAKRLGRKIKIRSDWENVKVGIMTDLNHIKFSKPEFTERLLATGDEQLVEGNDWGDQVWGKVNGKGQNLLGKILMQIRNELRI